MDKETLSNYGWIVIVILMLAVLIAFATPFGTKVKDGITDNTNLVANKAENMFDNALAGRDMNASTAGLYTTGTDTMLMSWDELISKGILTSDGAIVPGKESRLAGDLELPNAISTIGANAFFNCSNLTNIVIPDSVTSIGSAAFGECSSLTSVELPDSFSSIGYSAFALSGLSGDFVIPDGVSCLEHHTFAYTAITSITIPESVTVIGQEVFLGCYKLAKINYLGSTADWNNITFDATWDTNTGNYTIYCVDGDIAKS